MKFVFDIDGTLCFNGKSIDPSIIDALLQLQNADHELIYLHLHDRFVICYQYYQKSFINIH